MFLVLCQCILFIEKPLFKILTWTCYRKVMKGNTLLKKLKQNKNNPDNREFPVKSNYQNDTSCADIYYHYSPGWACEKKRWIHWTV